MKNYYEKKNYYEFVLLMSIYHQISAV